MSRFDEDDRAERRQPEFWFRAYAGEYLCSDEECVEAREDFEKMLTQFALETKASLPCYRWQSGTSSCDELDRWWTEQGHSLPRIEPPCPSCEARAQLVVNEPVTARRETDSMSEGLPTSRPPSPEEARLLTLKP